MKRIIQYKGSWKILPKFTVFPDGKMVKGNFRFSDELMELLLPYDLEFVTEYEKICRMNYVQVVVARGEFLFPYKEPLKILPATLHMVTADWIGDGRYTDINTDKWIKENIYQNFHALTYDRQVKTKKYCSGPQCPTGFPDNIEIKWREGKDHLGTILVNPEVAKEIKIKHRYPPYNMSPLVEGTKIRGPFIKGTVKFSNDVNGICFLEGSYKHIPDGPEAAIKCGFWVETLPHFLLKGKVTMSYTMWSQFARKLPTSEIVEKFMKLDFDRKELYKKIMFTSKGKPVKMKVIDAIREGAPINVGYIRKYINERITEEIHKYVFNPKIKGIRAIGIELPGDAKEVYIPYKYKKQFKIGDKVILWRDPVEWIGTIQLTKIKGYTNSDVIMLTKRHALAMDGDFDGDQYNIARRDSIDEIFGCNIHSILKSTPSSKDYTLKKEKVEVGSSKSEQYKIAVQVEMGKQATGMMIHLRDNAVFRQLCELLAVKMIYWMGAQQALQSKNSVIKTDYKKYPFELAKEISKELNIEYKGLISRNETLMTIRKRNRYGNYYPEKESLFYNDLQLYTKRYNVEFNSHAIAEILIHYYNISPENIHIAQRIYIHTRGIEDYKERVQMMWQNAQTIGLSYQTLIIVLLLNNNRLGYEYLMAKYLIDNCTTTSIYNDINPEVLNIGTQDMIS